MGTYTNIDHEALREAIANRTYGKAGLVAAGATVGTATAVNYSINGVMYQLAITASIDLATAAIETEPGTIPVATTVLARTQAAGKDRVYLLIVDAAGTISVVPGMTVDAGLSCPCPRVPPDRTAFGAIKVANASDAPFVLGTTSLAAEGVTATLFDLTMSPLPL